MAKNIKKKNTIPIPEAFNDLTIDKSKTPRSLEKVFITEPSGRVSKSAHLALQILLVI